MACAHPDTAADAAPGQYREVETPGQKPRRWIHDGTGLVVELFRYARPYHRHDPLPDHHEYRLVVRPDGPDGEGQCVDSTTDGFANGPNDRTPADVAREWMAAHPDGVFEGAV